MKPASDARAEALLSARVVFVACLGTFLLLALMCGGASAFAPPNEPGSSATNYATAVLLAAVIGTPVSLACAWGMYRLNPGHHLAVAADPSYPTDVRCAAINASPFGRKGVRVLVDVLGCGLEPLARCAAAKLLGWAEHKPECLDLIVDCLRATEREAVRLAAVRWLGQAWGRTPTWGDRQTAFLRGCLADESVLLAAESLTVLSERGYRTPADEKTVRERLLVGLTAGTPSRRRDAIREITDLGEHRSIAPIAIDLISNTAAGDAHPGVRVEAVAALARPHFGGDPGAATRVAELVLRSATADAHPGVRLEAFKALEAIDRLPGNGFPARKVALPLIRYAADEPRDELKKEVAELLRPHVPHLTQDAHVAELVREVTERASGEAVWKFVKTLGGQQWHRLVVRVIETQFARRDWIGADDGGTRRLTRAFDEAARTGGELLTAALNVIWGYLQPGVGDWMVMARTGRAKLADTLRNLSRVVPLALRPHVAGSLFQHFYATPLILIREQTRERDEVETACLDCISRVWPEVRPGRILKEIPVTSHNDPKRPWVFRFGAEMTHYRCTLRAECECGKPLAFCERALAGWSGDKSVVCCSSCRREYKVDIEWDEGKPGVHLSVGREVTETHFSSYDDSYHERTVWRNLPFTASVSAFYYVPCYANFTLAE